MRVVVRVVARVGARVVVRVVARVMILFLYVEERMGEVEVGIPTVTR